MRKSINVGGVITSVIVTVIGGFILFHITKDKVDIKYNLSAPISIPSEKYYVQQLKIQNIGNATAENLVITLNGNIQKYEIKKYSEQDYYQEYELSDNIGKQICYSKLPKEGSIVITMNISKPDSLKVEIKHDKGKATEVFSSQSKIGYALLFFIISILFYLVSSTKYFIDDYWISSVLQYDKKKILTKQQPFYFSESKWKEIKTLAIKNELAEIRNETFISVEGLKDSKATFYLTAQNLEKLELSDDEKKKMISETSEIYLKNLRIEYNRTYSEYEYIMAFSILRPELVEEAKWNEERERLLSNYKDYCISRCYNFYDIPNTAVYFDNVLSSIILSDIEKSKIKQDIKQWWLKNLKQWINGLSSDSDKKYIEQFFQTEKPNYFTQSEWESIKKITNDKYLEIILYKLSYSSKDDYEKILRKEKHEINYLPEDCCKKIKKYTEQLYCLSIMEDSLILSRKELVDKYDFTLLESNRITAILKLIDKAHSIEKLLNSPVEGIDKLEIPESVEKSFWNSIIEYRTKNAELNDKLQEVNNEELKLKVKIEKVLRQLTFINTILDSPDEIDRIEDYEDLFSKGNYENLRKIKGLLESNNTREKE